MEHTFYFREATTGRIVSCLGSDTLNDQTSLEYKALDCGNDLIDKFIAYYNLSHKKELPRPRLFAIACEDVNAFAVYEKNLNMYCIGIYLGAFRRVKEKTEEIVDMIIEKSENESEETQLILRSDRKRWIDIVYINAMRFFYST